MSPRTAEWAYAIEQDALEWSEDLRKFLDLGDGMNSASLRDYVERINPRDRSPFMGSFEAAIKDGSNLEVRYRIIDVHGTEHLVIHLGTVTGGRVGQPSHLRGYLHDITDLCATSDGKGSQERLGMLQEELQGARADLRSFTYHASHDLTAPLRTIVGFSEILKEDYSDELDERGKDYLGRVLAQAKHLESMLEDLLRLSRVMTAAYNPQRLDLSRIASTVMANREGAGPTPVIRIEEEMICEGDRELMETAMDCLIDNAIKFSRSRPGPEIEFGSRIVDGEVRFFVQDNGVGFDMNYRDRLFQPFQRLHSAKEYPGNGIGLAIVAAVVRRHGGRVWAESDVGKGATFSFILGRTAPLSQLVGSPYRRD